MKIPVDSPCKNWKRLIKTVKPAHQEFWNKVDKDRETFLRLDAVAKKLEASQAEAKEHTALPTKQVEDQVSPRDACVSCHQPGGHHLLKSSRDTLQEELKEAVHEVPVEPLKAPPRVAQPFPGDRTKFQLIPSPLAPVKFSIRLNRVAKMKTGPPSPKSQMLAAITTTPQVTIHKLTPEEIESLTTSV